LFICSLPYGVGVGDVEKVFVRKNPERTRYDDQYREHAIFSMQGNVGVFLLIK
jgi:hypothetical protein